MLFTTVLLVGVARDALAAAVEAPSSTTGSRDALYAAAGGVLVALIGAGTAILTSRSKTPTDPPPVRYLDPPSSNALPQALAELYEDALERAVKAERELAAAERLVDLWRERALDPAWPPP